MKFNVLFVMTAAGKVECWNRSLRSERVTVAFLKRIAVSENAQPLYAVRVTCKGLWS